MSTSLRALQRHLFDHLRFAMLLSVAFIILLGNMPGAMTFTVMWLGASWSARCRDKWCKAAFEAE